MTTSVQERTCSPRFPFATKIGLLFAALGLLAVLDVVHDLRDDGNPSLALVELASMALVIGTAAYYWWQAVRVRGQADRLVHKLDRAQADADRWRHEAANVLPKLGAAVQRQFDRWGFTEDERQISMLLLDGLSLQDIAHLLGTNVRTARQQAVGVYAKAGVAGRAELAAFFLSDLFYLAGVPTRRQDPVAAQM
jgi:DNA-binding CsgD family transcriptional regulator